MSRTVNEWEAKHDDQAIPARVKDRIAARSDDCCNLCKRPIMGKLRAEFDHIIPLIIGGKHAESNIQCICVECHKGKSALDAKLRAKVARVRSKHLGLYERRQKIHSAGFRKSSPQHSATRPLERAR